MEQTEIKKPQNQFQRAINIIVSPMSVIEDIQRKPNFLLPIGLILVIGFITSFLTKDLMAQLIDMSYANAGLTADQIASTKELTSGYMSVMLYVGILFIPLVPMVKGCVSHLLSILFSGEGTFGSTVSLMLNAYLIQMFGGLIALPVMLMTQNGAFGFSAALLLPLEKYGTPLFTTLSTLNLFTIWYLIVTVMGIKKLQNLSTWKATFIVLLPFILMTGFSWISVFIGGAPSGL